jgi:hypothetical protein
MPVLTNPEGEGIWTVPGRRRGAATAGARVVFLARPISGNPSSDRQECEWAMLVRSHIVLQTSGSASMASDAVAL